MNTATATTATAPIVTGISALLRRHRHTLLKTLSYYCLHITVAIAVAYVVTGNWWVAMTLSLLEPTVRRCSFFSTKNYGIEKIKSILRKPHH